MKKWIVLLLFLWTTTAHAQAPDRRISDNDGDVFVINTDGSMPVTLSGSGGIPTFGGGTTTAGNLLVADGNAFNSVALSGDVTVDAAGVATVPTGRVLLSEINGIDSAAATASNGNILIGDGTNFTSIRPPITFTQYSSSGFVGIGTTTVSTITDLLSLRGGANGSDAHATSGIYMGLDSGSRYRVDIVNLGGPNTYYDFANDATSDFDTRLTQGTETFAFSTANAAEVRVGIGTTSTAALQVTGHVRATAWTATAGNLLIANGTEFEGLALSGDLSLTSAGALTIGSSSVTATSGNLLVADGVKFNSVAVGASGMGTRIVSGANTACSTTCGSLARCFHGLDLVGGLLACSDATADTCFCGP